MLHVFMTKASTPSPLAGQNAWRGISYDRETCVSLARFHTEVEKQRCHEKSCRTLALSSSRILIILQIGVCQS